VIRQASGGNTSISRDPKHWAPQCKGSDAYVATAPSSADGLPLNGPDVYVHLGENSNSTRSRFKDGKEKRRVQKMPKKTVLSKQSVSSIADEVELRLKPGSGKSGSSGSLAETKQDGHGSKKLFFWGAVSGVALAVAAPMLSKQAKPAVRGAIKGGLVAGRYFQRVASSVKEDIEDMTAEAKAELNVERPESGPAREPKQSRKRQQSEQ
jgi:hypothetical protein